MNSLPAVHAFLASAAPAAGEGSAISVPTAILILVVGGLLFCIKGLLDLQRRVAELESAPPPPAAPGRAPVETAPPAAAPVEAIPPEIMAVIATAAHVALKGRVRLVAVTPLSADQQIWSIEGRRQVFQSHILR